MATQPKYPNIKAEGALDHLVWVVVHEGRICAAFEEDGEDEAKEWYDGLWQNDIDCAIYRRVGNVFKAQIELMTEKDGD